MRHYYNERDGQVAQAKRFLDSGDSSRTVVFSSPYTVKVRKEVESQRMEEVDLDTGRRRSWVEVTEYEDSTSRGRLPPSAGDPPWLTSASLATSLLLSSRSSGAATGTGRW